MARFRGTAGARPGLALLALLLVAAGFPVLVVAAQPLQPREAREHIGENRTVCGEVASTRYPAGSRGGTTFLNLGRPSE